MAKSLIFSISQEFRNEELFLILSVSEKNSSRIVYLSDLKEFGKNEKDLSLLLIQEASKAGGSLDTLNCSKIFVRASKALTIIQKLISSKCLLWKERSLFFNPMCKAKLEMEVESLSLNQLLISGFLHMGEEVFAMESVDFLFLGDPIWGICKQMVFVFPETMRKTWIDLVYPEPKKLEGKQKNRFIEDYKEDPPEDFPFVSWKGTFFEEPSIKTLPVLPYLVLKDSYGAFADLGMEYESKKIDFMDPRAFPGRNIESEKAWEKDLLETDFRVKVSDSSRYYCPMDKIVSSLSFLLDIGWKIFDCKGRLILKTSSADISLTSNCQGVLVKGSISYGKHKADITDVVGSFNRRKQFIELSPSHVGLLDRSTHYEGMEELLESEVCSEGCLISKKRGGVLDSFLERKDVVCDGKTRLFLDRLKSSAVLEETSFPQLKGFQGTLRSYQKEGVHWLTFLHQNQFSGLLCDEMGLGKTVQILAFLSEISSNKPILIVVPTSLVFNWKKEWEAFILEKELYVHEGSKRSGDLSFLESKTAILTSYACLRLDFLLFQKMYFSCIVLDEAQSIKNPESQLAKVAYGLKGEMKIGLTGTPIENRADDLWSLFHFLEPDLLGERKDFLASLDSAQVDSRHKQRITKTIRPFILRRLKETVAKDLPEKIEQIVWVEMKESQRDFYEKWLFKTKAGLLQKIKLEGGKAHRMEVLEAILRLRQICCHPFLVDSEELLGQEAPSSKLEQVLLDLEEIVLDGRKVLVYSQFTQMLSLVKKEIEKRGWSYAYLDGETRDREAAVFSFQNNPSIQIFLISLKAGGVGLNLTAADYVFLLDPWWNEAVERQAIDRAHRLGRQGTVIARRYVVVESIEEKIMKLKEHKVSLAEGILDLDGQIGSLNLDQMMELLN